MNRIRRPNRWRWSERGAAAVEMAMVLPLLLFIVFGIIDFGRMLNTQITLTEAAREGSRAVVIGTSPTSISARANDRVSQVGVPTGVTTTVQACTPAGTPACRSLSSASGSCSANLQSGEDHIRVTTTYTFKFVTPLAAIGTLLRGRANGADATLTGRGVMPCVG